MSLIDGMRFFLRDPTHCLIAMYCCCKLHLGGFICTDLTVDNDEVYREFRTHYTEVNTYFKLVHKGC